MNRIVKQFIKSFDNISKKQDWDKIYVGIDLHETILKPTWTSELSTEFYENSKEVLQIMSNRKDICLIMWTCSLPELSKQYFDFFQENGIIFDYINENPEVTSTIYADFETKLYFNVGLDDKFGFEEEDWKELLKYFNK